MQSNASSVVWNLKFFDETEHLKGIGQFSYDPSTTDCLNVSLAEECSYATEEMQRSAGAHLTTNYVDSLSINWPNILVHQPA